MNFIGLAGSFLLLGLGDKWHFVVVEFLVFFLGRFWHFVFERDGEAVNVQRIDFELIFSVVEIEHRFGHLKNQELDSCDYQIRKLHYRKGQLLH